MGIGGEGTKLKFQWEQTCVLLKRKVVLQTIILKDFFFPIMLYFNHNMASVLKNQENTFLKTIEWKKYSVLNSLLFFCFGIKISVPFRHGERIGFSYLVSQKYTGDTAVVKVHRNSKILEFSIKLATHKRLIPAHIKGRPPSYYIIGGFVFTAVSVLYLRSEVHTLTLSLLHVCVHLYFIFAFIFALNCPLSWGKITLLFSLIKKMREHTIQV